MSHPTSPRDLAEAYFRAWRDGDAETLRAVLAPDCTFRGPLGAADDAEACIAGLLGMRQVLDHIEVHARVADDAQVVTWFDLHTTVAPPAPTANWSRVADGRIVTVRVAFDPRPLLAGLEATQSDGPQ